MAKYTLHNEHGDFMSGYCEDCGCEVYNGRCTNCHEELYILDQYIELDMPLPDEDSEFMKKANECLSLTNKLQRT